MATRYQKRSEYSQIDTNWNSPFWKGLSKKERHELLHEMALGTSRAVRQDYGRAIKRGVTNAAMGQIEFSYGAESGKLKIDVRGKSDVELRKIIKRNKGYLLRNEGGATTKGRSDLDELNEKLHRNLTAEEVSKLEEQQEKRKKKWNKQKHKDGEKFDEINFKRYEKLTFNHTSNFYRGYNKWKDSHPLHAGYDSEQRRLDYSYFYADIDGDSLSLDELLGFIEQENKRNIANRP